MLLPKTKDQKFIYKYYFNLKWNKIKLGNYTYWHRNSIKHGILLAISLQSQKNKIYISDVIKVIGRPDKIEGTLKNGMVFYTYRHSSDIGIGLYGLALGINNQSIYLAGSNRMDYFTYKITRRDFRLEKK